MTDVSGNAVSTLAKVARTAPGVFTANESGQGVAAAQVVRVAADGSQSVMNTATWNASTSSFVPNPIPAASAADRLFLILYATGLRHAGSVTARVNGANAAVFYAGAQSSYPGLDQVNLELPRNLTGAGAVNVVITVDGQAANLVTITFE